MRTGQFTSGGALSPFEQAAAAGFDPWQDMTTYSNADYARGDLPGSLDYTKEIPWRPSSPQGVAFDVGFVGPGGPVVEDRNALRDYAASIGFPYPDMNMFTDPDERNAAVSNWYTAVLEASLAPAP